jgi:hypothetical protein
MLPEPQDAVVPSYPQTDDFLSGSDRHHCRSLTAFWQPPPEPLSPVWLQREHPIPVTRGFARAGPPAPGQAALPASERAAAKGLPRASVHFRRPEGLRLEVPLRGFSLAIGCRVGRILSIPRNEQWMVQPYIQPMRPQPPLPGRTPRRPIRLPRQRHRHVPGPMLPGRASKISPLQQ